jgi:hypothetical protein
VQPGAETRRGLRQFEHECPIGAPEVAHTGLRG